MQRTPFFILVITGNPPSKFITRSISIRGGTEQRVHYDRIVISGRTFLIYRLASNVLYLLRRWDIYYLLPEKEGVLELKAFNEINRSSRELVNTTGGLQNILGPYTTEDFDALGIVAPELLRNERGELCVPIAFVGDTPEKDAAILYKPTIEQCDADITPIESEVFSRTVITSVGEESDGLGEIIKR